MRVLIAEDEFINRRIMEQMLSFYGQCDVVSNGREAVEEYKKSVESGKPYNLVCLDIMMPEMNGQKVLKTIRDFELLEGITQDTAAKIIMITSLSDSPTINKAFLLDCNGYLVKPVNKSRLNNLLLELGFEADSL